MKKCSHKNLANKFIFSDKYGEAIKVEYTYCQDCGEIFKGGVNFIPKPKLKPKPRKKPISKKKILKQSNPISPVDEKLKEAKNIQVKITAKGNSSVNLNPPEKKKAPKLVVKQDKPVINKAPKRKVSELRKNNKKPEASEVPEGATLSDILKAKYGIKSEPNKLKSTEPVKDTRKYKDVEEDDLNDDDSDVTIFVK